jgi:hypothetical protein
LSVFERVERLAENFSDFECFWTLLQLLHDGIVRIDAAKPSFFQRSQDPLRIFIVGSGGCAS